GPSRPPAPDTARRFSEEDHRGRRRDDHGRGAHWSDAFAARFRARWVPVRHQVEHQSRTVVAAARQARVGLR
ncbi:hypothetical protein ACWEFQ_32885, partial [Streptomyces albogriseolus]